MGKCYEEILWGSVMGKRCGVVLRELLWETLWTNVMVKFNGEVLWGNFKCMWKCYGKMMCTKVYFICNRIFLSVNTAKI